MEIKYLNKDFKDFKNNLINISKTYFPNVYQDFSPSSVGGMFIDMASAIGDILSFYTDTQIQENYLLEAKQKENLFSISYSFGYRPQVTYPSTTYVDVYQLVPSIEVSGSLVPNTTYCTYIPSYTNLYTAYNDINFITLDEVDFSKTKSLDINFLNNDYFIFRQSVKSISATIKSIDFNFSNAEKFNNIYINDSKIIKILDVTDSNGEKWYEVPYLAQSYIPNNIPNNIKNNSDYNVNDNINFILEYKKCNKRFVSRFIDDNTLQIEFGAGISSNFDEKIIPNSDNVGLGTFNSISLLDQTFNPSKFLETYEYGLAPSNTTLTFRYLVGGGIESNVESNIINNIDISNITFKSQPYDSGNVINTPQQQYVLNNITCLNPSGSTGGKGGDTIEELRLNALNAYPSQLRAVTKEDYILRTYNLPSEYGSVAKAFIKSEDAILNPYSLGLYILTYDSNNNLTLPSTTLKNNLKQYLSQYKMIGDGINIKNAFIINYEINFSINVNANYNNNEVVLECIKALKDYVNIQKWNINQPIIISDINNVLLKTKGVQGVSSLEIFNKNGGLYSVYGYDINAATKNNIIYPPLVPSIFECKFPDQDIKGKSSNF